jgi:hypothetical protein
MTTTSSAADDDEEFGRQVIDGGSTSATTGSSTPATTGRSAPQTYGVGSDTAQPMQAYLDTDTSVLFPDGHHRDL